MVLLTPLPLVSRAACTFTGQSGAAKPLSETSAEDQALPDAVPLGIIFAPAINPDGRTCGPRLHGHGPVLITCSPHLIESFPEPGRLVTCAGSGFFDRSFGDF